VGRLSDMNGHDLESIAHLSVPKCLEVYEHVKVVSLEQQAKKMQVRVIAPSVTYAASKTAQRK